MVLIIGGAFQGKTEYVKEKYGVKDAEIYDAVIPNNPDGRIVINHLHEYIRRSMKNGENPEEEIEKITEHENVVILCDEIGNGVVPFDPFEREFRERTGRILIRIAAKAETVERVVCGIAMRIK